MDLAPTSHDTSPDEGATVARIMYASQSTVTTSVYAEMEKIRAAAVRHNEPLGVATALLYQSGWFVQWKEGPGSALLRIMDRVAGDPRHHSVRIVHSSRGPRLLSGPWSMAIVQCDESPADMSRRVLELRRAMDQGMQYPPPAVWRRLSTPMRHPGAARQADPDAFQRVMVCSSEGVSAFELTQWLAHATGEELVHRRFAGAQFLDVASDYVDVERGDRVLRLIAMARNGLQLPLTRAFLPDYSHVVMLLGTDVERNLALMQRVIQACQGLVSPPALLGVAPRQDLHDAPYALARRCGHIYLAALADPEDREACWAAAEPLLQKWQLAANSSSGPVELRRVSGR
ncbi:BLUF domain-containing protein [Ramlibacter sp.]|uniref:BLUF domain-containing protein n=1 Tax=Ramlibacter sp. TaxID=1917967 RepID=UPI0035B47A88